MKKVLVVDDDRNICELVQLYFEKDGFQVKTVNDGEMALEEIDKYNPNVVILDLMLPGKDGYEVCREIRKTSNVPILMLTARGDTLDKIVGLELGADDYISKPFDPKELVVRAKTVLRRTEAACPEAKAIDNDDHPAEQITHKDLVIDKSSYTVTFHGTRIDMPPKELELLYFLASHPNRVFNREQLLGQVWGYDFYGESRTVDVHIKRVREKIDDIGEHPSWDIKTVWGVGYKFEVTGE
ncbi:response regulator transcription factor [Mageeibacillus indolicus]|jgi:hypothetical protein|uniref:Stage 0 sporulation protein A homolog n=2 Tax=Mageeibacillus indolicus TaxID=884684 RepID=D3R0H7_MAGIU|nr:response regulator transcription factor [Mageeibacillus indolicus]ADC91444.1 response regulator receiver domain protein [Mageeibacillus indolicus UPII9-5]KFA56761.1 transcriptional regulator [Mageeibacillus indolicus 0009-5]PNH18789.1 DNA-binding response regulator [Mageeibacillus indolicus]